LPFYLTLLNLNFTISTIIAVQQPNSNTTSQHLVSPSREVTLIPNMPAINVQDQLHQITTGIQNMQQQIEDIQKQIGDMQKQIGTPGKD
jgi:peptidoglycan hydrolase CwlO-like protein